MVNKIEFDQPPITFTLASGRVLDGSANYPAATTKLSVFLCPSDPNGTGRVPLSEYGATNYVACAGSGQVNAGSIRGTEADGSFFAEAIAMRDILDGSSNTVFISERTLGRSAPESTKRYAQTAVWEIASTRPVSPEACANRSNGSWYGFRGEKWIIGNYGNTLYNHFYAPNSHEHDCMNIRQQSGFMAARSMHVGGVNTLYGDGSVRFESQSIDLNIWRELSTRAGREVVVR